MVFRWGGWWWEVVRRGILGEGFFFVCVFWWVESPRTESAPLNDAQTILSYISSRLCALLTFLCSFQGFRTHISSKSFPVRRSAAKRLQWCLFWLRRSLQRCLLIIGCWVGDFGGWCRPFCPECNSWSHYCHPIPASSYPYQFFVYSHSIWNILSPCHPSYGDAVQPDFNSF